MTEEAVARLQFSRRRREVPVVHQLTPTECGAACLSMVLAYHGKEIPVDQLRDATGADRDGATALGILQAAERFGLRGRGVAVDVPDLECLEPATILHWEFNHFVVFERIRGDTVEIVDPMYGRRRVTMDEVRRAFTGVALLLEPGEGFAREKR